MKLQRAGNNISGLVLYVILYMWKYKWKDSRSSRTPTLQRALHNAFSLPPSSSPLSLSQSVSRNGKAAVVRENSRQDTCRLKRCENRDAGAWIRLVADFYRDEKLLSGCLDILRDILRRIRAASFTHLPVLHLGIPKIILDASFGDYIDLSYFIPIRTSEELYPPSPA